MRLTRSFNDFVSAFMSLSESSKLTWIGAVEPNTDSCKWCRSIVIKAMASCTASVVRECVDEMSRGHKAPETYPEIRECVFTLRRMQSDDPETFARTLAETPAIQREYIWTTKSLEWLKPYLNFSVSEGLLNEHLCFYALNLPTFTYFFQAKFWRVYPSKHRNL